jgi:hypothetical protein
MALEPAIHENVVLFFGMEQTRRGVEKEHHLLPNSRMTGTIPPFFPMPP